ncbi:hypothetical protein EWM60_04540 [Candidatus Erwinia dacicola]|nr:hypothetical protein [Candidatus Erwinia dacicola]NJD85068.1 hypothetical protein [Candidatus Erwinia dacicola]
MGAPVRSGGFLGAAQPLQNGALSAGARLLAISLGKQFDVPSSVDSRNNVYRVQLGHFSSHSLAAALQQRLTNEAQQQSFITVAP